MRRVSLTLDNDQFEKLRKYKKPGYSWEKYILGLVYLVEMYAPTDSLEDKPKTLPDHAPSTV